jgi:methyl-accepting chemotaxis protein
MVVSRENDNTVEDVSAGAEEISAQVEEFSGGAQSMAEMAHKLQAYVAEFRLADL